MLFGYSLLSWLIALLVFFFVFLVLRWLLGLLLVAIGLAVPDVIVLLFCLLVAIGAAFGGLRAYPARSA